MQLIRQPQRSFVALEPIAIDPDDEA